MIDGIWDTIDQQSSEFWAGCVSLDVIRWKGIGADDRSPIPGGDLREAKPYMIVNTGLRRLGCGARAALGIEPPAYVTLPFTLPGKIGLPNAQSGTTTKIPRTI